jgi:fructokinase
MTGGLRIGIDLGGTKIEGAVLDCAGKIRARRRVATPAGDYAGTIAAIAALVAALEDEIGAQRRTSVGIGMPGALSPASGLVKNANSTCLNGRPFTRDVEAALGRPARFANDANCFTLSEATDGAASGCASVFGVILGTGVGGGLAFDGQVREGANAIAGEWGHNPLPAPGPDERPGAPCYCGRSGCIETFLSGPGLAADHRVHTGRTLGASAIAAAAASGDREARASLARYADRLARGLATVINLVDPAAIVLGGGLSAIASLYEDVPRLWSRHVFSDQVATRLLPPLHGAASGVRGAAWLWPADAVPC